MIRSKLLCRLGLGLGISVLCAPLALANGPDEQWSMSVKMSMTKPMSMSMPAMTSKTCQPKDVDQGPPPMKGSDCKVTHWDRAGSKVSFEVTCNQNGSVMTGKGWSEKIGDDQMKGQMQMSGSAGGTPMAMSVAYTGKRIGSCTADKEAAE